MDSAIAEAAGEYAKLFREAISLIRSLGAVVTVVQNHRYRRRDQDAARNLYLIAFTPSGMLDLLKQLAAAEGDSHDELDEENEDIHGPREYYDTKKCEQNSSLRTALIKQISEKLEDSSEDTEIALQRLRNYIDEIREREGFRRAVGFEELLFGGGDSKTRIILSIREIISRFKEHPDKPGQARKIVNQIEALNIRMQDYHDFILSERRPPSGRKKGSAGSDVVKQKAAGSSRKKPSV